MKLRSLIASAGLLLSTQLYAFDCYFTLVKDSCWANYEVTVNVVDAVANKRLTTVVVPKGQSWARNQFTCMPNQNLMYYATFSPIIWQSKKDKIYQAKKYWILPKAPKEGELAWNIPVCFSREFSEVPFPPDASGNCQCDFDSVPAIKLTK